MTGNMRTAIKNMVRAFGLMLLLVGLLLVWGSGIARSNGSRLKERCMRSVVAMDRVHGLPAKHQLGVDIVWHSTR